jgi:germination protein M
MLKKFAYKRIVIITISLIVLLIVYLFPDNEKYNINTTISYTKPETVPIYLVDNINNLVARFEIIKKSDNTLDLIEEVINNLKVDNKSNSHIPDNFQKIIPANTKILEKSLSNGLLKINFSKELLNIDEDNEEKLIEAIVYSLTEIKDVKKIMLFVDGVNLIKLPKSQKTIPNILDRSYGINKIYDITSMKDISKTTTYYVNKIDNYTYYIPVTLVANNNKEKVEIIIEKLKAMPTYGVDLISYLTAAAELQNYEILENSINLSFNNEILNLENNKIIEEVKYAIALSIRDTYDIYETIFYIDNNLVDAVFI